MLLQTPDLFNGHIVRMLIFWKFVFNDQLWESYPAALFIVSLWFYLSMEKTKKKYEKLNEMNCSFKSEIQQKLRDNNNNFS